jgi:alpha-L-fucosidase
MSDTAQAAPSSRTDWFRAARFGMFVHFGLYSIPAGVWNGVRMGRNDYAEWIQMQGDWPRGVPGDEYRALAAQFNPTGFDADEWVTRLADAGMRYLVLTSKHHDGFALWPSRASRFTVADASPFGRDIVGELKAACDARGVRFGLYYSHWLDWEHPHGGRPHEEEFFSEPRWEQPSQEHFEGYWQGKCLPQVRELLDDYDPALLWFDTWAANSSLWINERRIDELVSLVRTRRPECLINSRIGVWGHPRGEEIVDLVSTDDNAFPDRRLARAWETSGTMNHSWGHHRLDFAWKPARALLKNLIHNAARGGNYQLNVGPTADGRFPAPAVRRLREIGAWLGANGEAVYGTEHNPLGTAAQPWGEITRRADGAAERWYLHLTDFRPGEPLIVTGLNAAPASAHVLETGQPVATEATPDGLRVTPPAELSPDDLPVLTLDFDAAPPTATA